MTNAKVEDINYGDRIEIIGRLNAPRTKRNPFDFSYKNYLARKDIFAVVSVSNESRIRVMEKRSGFSLRGSILIPVKAHILKVIDGTLRGEANALLKGIMLGKREALPEEIEENFSDAGVIHVLAVSGLHVGLIMTILLALSVAFTRWSRRLPFSVPFFITIFGVIFYALLIGKRPSSIRASIMVIVFLFSMVIQRRGFSLNTVGFAALIILIFDPRMLFDVGFQLSFAAVLSIIYVFPFIKSFIPHGFFNTGLKKIFSGLILISFCAILGTAPIVAFYFAKFSPIALVANLFVVPPMTFIVALGFSSAFFGIFSIGVARIFAAANWFLIQYTIIAAEFFADIPLGNMIVQPPSPTFLISYYACLIALPISKNSMKVRKFLVFFGLIALNFFIWKTAITYQPARELSVTFLDVGQGDCIFVEFPFGENMLIDGGRTGSGERVIIPFLQRKKVKKLDYVVCTHAHNDHIGGLPEVLEKISVEKVLDSGQPYASFSYRDYLRIIAEKQIDFREVKAGEKLKIQDVDVEILHPTENFLYELGEEPEDFNLNNASVTLKVTYGNVSFLFTGDIEEEVEAEIIERFSDRLESVILKAAHHGSSSSSSQEFLGVVDPKIIVIQCGIDNKFEHPHEETLKKYEELGGKIYRSDRDGAIKIIADKYRIKSEVVIK